MTRVQCGEHIILYLTYPGKDTIIVNNRLVRTGNLDWLLTYAESLETSVVFLIEELRKRMNNRYEEKEAVKVEEKFKEKFEEAAKKDREAARTPQPPKPKPDTSWANTPGKRIRLRREELGLTPFQASEKCLGYGKTVDFCLYECDHHSQPYFIKAWQKIAEGLGVSLEWLLEGEEPKAPRGPFDLGGKPIENGKWYWIMKAKDAESALDPRPIKICVISEDRQFVHDQNRNIYEVFKYLFYPCELPPI